MPLSDDSIRRRAESFAKGGIMEWVDWNEDLWEKAKSGKPAAEALAECRTELMVSRDGQKWDRVAPMWEFMRRGLWGTWDRDHVGVAKPIVHDDQMLLYYLGSNIPLAANLPDHPQFPVLNTVVDGYDSPGTLTTVPLTSNGDRLVVNARAPESAFDAHAPSPHGRLRAEVLDARAHTIEGYSADDCDPFTGDDLRHVVTWKGCTDLPRDYGDVFRLRFHMSNAALY
jgi:hypothetical protein